MFVYLLLCIIGIAALVYSSDKLIESASKFALNLKFSKMAIGLTITAIGTSLPELFVSLNASLKGDPALSLGNIIGSNIMNIALILGISAIILPVNSTKEIVKREIPFMIAVTGLFWVFARTDSRITPNEGIILIAVFIVYHIIIYLLSKKESKLTEEYVSSKASKYCLPVQFRAAISTLRRIRAPSLSFTFWAASPAALPIRRRIVGFVAAS